MISSEGTAQEESERDDIAAFLSRAKQNGYPDSHWPLVEDLIWEHAEALSTSFSATDENVPSLRIELKEGALPTRIMLRNYSASQRNFMATLTE